MSTHPSAYSTQTKDQVLTREPNQLERLIGSLYIS